MLLCDIPQRNSLFYPEKPAVIEGNIKISFDRFNKRIEKLGNAILSMNLSKGDRVAILSQNCYQYLELYFACASIGTPVVPLNFRYHPSELLFVIKDSGAKAIFFNERYQALVASLRSQSTSIENYICIDESLAWAKNYESLISGVPSSRAEIEIHEDDIAILGYTGGTTGKPKGVMTTHRNIITSCYNTALERGLTTNDIFLNVPPVFHAGGANSMFAFSFLGATNVFIENSGMENVLSAIEKYNVTDLVLVPTMISSLLEVEDLKAYDLSTLKAIYYGTAPISVELLKHMMKLFKFELSQTYGMTETFVPISILKPEDHIITGNSTASRIASAGRQVMGVKVKIVDEKGKEVPIGEIGEIIVNGKNVMKGYWNQPELTEETIKNGWLYTGDMGKIDNLGYIYIVDRKKDMIISGGENIYAKEVEDVLFSHPGVADAVVIGVPDAKWGEVVKAIVIRKRDYKLSEIELIKYCKDHLTSYKKPKSIEFLEEFPKSTAGKILKRELKLKYGKI